MNRRNFVEKSSLSSLEILSATYLPAYQEKKTIPNNKQAAKLLASPYRDNYKRPEI